MLDLAIMADAEATAYAVERGFTRETVNKMKAVVIHLVLLFAVIGGSLKFIAFVVTGDSRIFPKD